MDFTRKRKGWCVIFLSFGANCSYDIVNVLTVVKPFRNTHFGNLVNNVTWDRGSHGAGVVWITCTNERGPFPLVVTFHNAAVILTRVPSSFFIFISWRICFPFEIPGPGFLNFAPPDESLWFCAAFWRLAFWVRGIPKRLSEAFCW